MHSIVGQGRQRKTQRIEAADNVGNGADARSGEDEPKTVRASVEPYVLERGFPLAPRG